MLRTSLIVYIDQTIQNHLGRTFRQQPCPNLPNEAACSNILPARNLVSYSVKVEQGANFHFHNGSHRCYCCCYTLQARFLRAPLRPNRLQGRHLRRRCRPLPGNGELHGMLLDVHGDGSISTGRFCKSAYWKQRGGGGNGRGESGDFVCRRGGYEEGG